MSSPWDNQGLESSKKVKFGLAWPGAAVHALQEELGCPLWSWGWQLSGVYTPVFVPYCAGDRVAVG